MRFFLLSGFGNFKKRIARSRRAIALITGAGVIFRSELAILLAMLSISFFLTQKNSLKNVVFPTGLAAAPAALFVTVSIDSFFWQAFPIWPEFIAFRYNTLVGKSAEWGTSPWHFYITTAIRKLMMNPMSYDVCLPIGAFVYATRRFSLKTLFPLAGYVCLYSILPHKEWRFIVYIIPPLTAVSASGAAWIWNRRAKSLFYSCLNLVLVTSVMGTFISSLAMSAISSLNYPGAHALNRLHELAAFSNGTTRVHLDNLSCQTGVTRFLQQPAPERMDGDQSSPLWMYDKTEDEMLLRDPLFWAKLDYAISETNDLPGEWDIIDTVKSYDGIEYNGGDGIVSLLLEGPAGRLGFDISRLMTYEHAIANWVKRHLTAGRWPVIRMKPNLHILKRQKT
ncbi:MAG: dolichyl-P-Man:Man(7)GlcNAc(2)-PP-dolichol alpha-1,6-mannosyltransferase [Alyxoria varia]|nr:MAG: dolichyl-P-Man:Man(7)GlcNAc(2)-PP-dolichol alpha-1,6-mannosyltransferase [Alyxoria varia]